MGKTKILTITTTGLGKKEGISTVILDYYSYFDKDKFQLDIIASGKYGYQLVTEFQNIGVNIRVLPSRKHSVTKYIKAFYKLFKEEHYNAIYMHGSSAIMSIELFIAKMCGCRTRIVHSHNTTCDHKKADKLLRPVFYRLYTKALACGNDAGKWLYGGREFDIVKNGRNVSVYKYDPMRRKKMRESLGVNDSTLLVGHVGNFNKQKNQIYAVDVFKDLLVKNKDAKMYLMGDGALRESVEKYISDNGLNDFIEFTGNITNVPDMLQAMDVMLLPSLHEGLPLVAVEWQICGLPCILSDKVTTECAYMDYVKFLPLSDDRSKWVEAILSFKGFDRDAVADEAVKRTIEEGFSLEENASKLQEYFQ